METYIFFFFLKDGILLYGPGCLRILYVDQAGLKVTEICLPLPPKGGLKVGATSPGRHSLCHE